MKPIEEIFEAHTTEVDGETTTDVGAVMADMMAELQGTTYRVEPTEQLLLLQGHVGDALRTIVGILIEQLSAVGAFETEDDAKQTYADIVSSFALDWLQRNYEVVWHKSQQSGLTIASHIPEGL